MSNNAQKTPLAQSLSRLIKGKTDDSQQLQGQCLPCTVVAVEGAIVTVAFEIQSGFTLPRVTMPLFGPEWIRYPIQVGCKGFAVPANARLGGQSGLGGGVSTLNQPANLAALVFFPIGSKDWSEVDPNALVMYGPNGVVLRAVSGDAVVTLTPNEINMQAGGATIDIVGGNVTITTPSGDLIINGIAFAPHYHDGVMTGGGDTGGVAG